MKPAIAVFSLVLLLGLASSQSPRGDDVMGPPLPPPEDKGGQAPQAPESGGDVGPVDDPVIYPGEIIRAAAEWEDGWAGVPSSWLNATAVGK